MQQTFQKKGGASDGQISAFATAKEQLRFAIETCAKQAGSIDEFRKLMFDLFDITVKESRGRYSYIIPGRERGITDRQLGTDYKKDFLEKVIRGEEHFSEKPLPYYRAVYHKTEVARMTDLVENEKAQNSPGYAYRIKLSNLQKMAGSLNYLSEKKISDLPEIDRRMEMVSDVLQENQELLKSVESRMTEIRGLIETLETYKKLKPVAVAVKDGKHSEAFRKTHDAELMVYQRARETLKKHYSLKNLPSAKLLKEEYQELSDQRNLLYEERSTIRKEHKDLENARYNLTQMFKKTRQQEILL